MKRDSGNSPVAPGDDRTNRRNHPPPGRHHENKLDAGPGVLYNINLDI